MSPGLAPPKDSAPRRSGAHLARRLTSALVGIPMVLGAAWVGPPWLTLLAALAAMIAALELGGMVRQSSALPPLALTALWAGSIVAGAHFLAGGASFAQSMGPVLAGGALASGLVALHWRGPRPWLGWLCQGLAALYAGGLVSYAVLLREVDQGREWLLLAIVVTFATDTGAFAIGRMLGHRPMAPRISPSKTWEGAAGGLVCAVAALLALNTVLGLGLPWWRAAVLAAAMGVAAQAGDLLESRVKRMAGVKDSGWMVPGHGGLMDRLDSIVLNLPLVYYSVKWWL